MKFIWLFLFTQSRNGEQIVSVYHFLLNFDQIGHVVKHV